MPEPEAAKQPETEAITFEVPRGTTRGVFIYEVEGLGNPQMLGHGDITMGQIYRLFQEGVQGANTRMIADLVVERLLGSMMPPEMMAAQEDDGLQMPESPHTEPVDGDIPEIN